MNAPSTTPRGLRPHICGSTSRVFFKMYWYSPCMDLKCCTPIDSMPISVSLASRIFFRRGESREAEPPQPKTTETEGVSGDADPPINLGPMRRDPREN